MVTKLSKEIKHGLKVCHKFYGDRCHERRVYGMFQKFWEEESAAARVVKVVR